ncbi:uncharacterized protein G2W53_026474 [Senna tora]|uniref:Uncharacterized protein n=1 Tax=Senna tora TaxID=362788 RepID=A0A834TH84_9FABA|nr:uncharacterized protein G2W53_026474 [Senna tora]
MWRKTCCASELNMSVRFVFPNPSGYDAPIGVFMAWEERGSCINIFQMTNRVESHKRSRITRQKICCACELNTSVRFVSANPSRYDAPIGVFMEWEERGSCLNIFRLTNLVVMGWELCGSCLNIFQTRNRGQILETFTNYEAKVLLRKQKTCCAWERNTSVRVVFANPSGFDAPIGVFKEWEERGSCLNIFRTKNHGQIPEKFTNYEAKDLLHK